MRMLLIGLLAAAAAIALYDLAVLGLALWRGGQVAAASEPFQRREGDFRAALLVVGDSTAVGTGAADPEDSVAGRIGADFPALRVDNLGTNGALTSAVPEQLARAPRPRYDAVLIQVGGNDALRFTGRASLAADIEDVLRAAQQLSDNIALMSTGKLGLAPALPWPLDGVFTARARMVRDVFSAAADRFGAHYIDLFITADRDNPFVTQADEYHARDGLHASGAGYGAWYDKLRAQVPLREWLGSAAAPAAKPPPPA